MHPDRGVQPRPRPAALHILPHLWFRNTWALGPRAAARSRASRAGAGRARRRQLVDRRLRTRPAAEPAVRYRLGREYLYAPTGGRPLFTDNETNTAARLRPPARSRSRFVKDAFHRHVIHGERLRRTRPRSGPRPPPLSLDASRPAGSVVLRLRLTDGRAAPTRWRTSMRSSTHAAREADEFYAAFHPPEATADEQLVQRQALAGLLWTKQCYLFDVHPWLRRRRPRLAAAGHRARRSATSTGGT